MIKYLVLSALLFASPALAEPTYPELGRGRAVLDAADVLTPEQEEAIQQSLYEIGKKSGHQMMVLTVPSLQGYAISDFGNYAFRHYGIGSRDADDGILMTVAPTERKARIDTGRGMGDLLTDADASVILNEKMVPHFKSKKDWNGGIVAGIEAVSDAIVPMSPEQIMVQQRAEQQQKQRAAAAWDSFLNFLFWVASGIAGIAGLFGIQRLATRKKRREAREEQARLAAIRDEEDRIATEARRAQAEKDREAQRVRERARIAAEKAAWDALSPSQQAAQLRIQAAEAERARIAEDKRRAAQRVRDDAAREKARREESSNAVIFGSTSGSSGSSTSSYGGGSDNSVSFGGGTSDGGGADAGWSD
jgi:uncharacterized protein